MNIPFLEESLQNYHNKEIVEFLRYGWPLGTLGDIPDVLPSRNHGSSRKYPKQIDDCIKKGMEHRTLIGPFQEIHFGSVVNPLATVDKHDSEEICLPPVVAR